MNLSKEQVIKSIGEQRSRLVYVSGKTCTGKTTFANELHLFGYVPIELDQIVTRSVIDQFHVHSREAFLAAFRGDGPIEHIDAFIAAARAEIIERRKSADLAIEGAVEKVWILEKIFSDELADFRFVYFHPVNLDSYVERIRTRFIAGKASTACGLPKDFWALVHQEDIYFFLATNAINERLDDSLHAYATRSMAESIERLQRFQAAYPDLTVVEV
jgi:hypothetical protein